MTAPDHGEQPRRYLLATAVATHTEAPHWNRPGLEQAREQMIELFTERFGYEFVTTLGMNPTQFQLRKELRGFCIRGDLRPQDIVVFYFTGHGHRLDQTGEYVLVTSDTDPADLPSAMTTTELARVMLLGTPVRRLLLILDTCYSGQGGAEFAAASATAVTGHWRDEPDNGVVVITSTQPRQFARAGVFPRLFREAAESGATAGEIPDTLPLDTITKALQRNPELSREQRVEFHHVRGSGPVPPFLPNPRRKPSEVDLVLARVAERESHSTRRDDEFRNRLLPLARGSTDPRFWWFCGRHRALTDISAWLSEPRAARPLLAVTGAPGSGKSAVLGLIATLTHPEYRRIVPTATLGLPEAAVPPPGSVDVAFHARRLSVEEVRAGIAAAADVPAGKGTELVGALRRREGTMTVLIDALDEAENPDELVRELLWPLVHHCGGSFRLLVGTRPDLLKALRADRADAIDLDAPDYVDFPALAAYVRRGLVEGTPETVYARLDGVFVGAIAHAVAAQSAPSFLVARTVTETLAADPRIPDPYDLDWQRSLPKLLDQAMHLDLESRLRENADKARALLRPLAFAEGEGLPWEDLWAPLASRIAGADYTDDDLMWLRRNAESFMVESTEAGRSAYRPYHRAMAEYLKGDHDPITVHTAFFEVLRGRVPVTADGHRDWSRAHPYTLRHLATHAAHAARLDDLIADMDYLVHAVPEALLAALPTIATETGRLTRAIYRCSADRHRTLPSARRRQVLALDAARFHAEDQLRELNRTLIWQPRWATGNLTHRAHRGTLAGHALAVNAVAVHRVDGHHVAVTTSKDETARIWDLATASERAVLQGHRGWVNDVVCTTLEHRPVAITTSNDHTARVWDLTDATETAVLTGHTEPVNSVAVTDLDGHPVAVTTSDDHTARIWDLHTATTRAVLTGHTGWVDAVTCTRIDGRPVAVTTGDDHTARVWDLATGTERAVLRGHESWLNAVATLDIDGIPIAVTTSQDETVRVWDLRTGTQTAVLTGHAGAVGAVATTRLDGRPVAVTAGDDHTVRVWDLFAHTQRAVLRGHTSWVIAGAVADIDGQPVAITTGQDRTARIWNLTGATPRETLTGHTAPVIAVAVADVDGHPVAITTGEDRTARVWDLDTTPGATDNGNDNGWLAAVAVADIDRTPVALTTGRDNTVRVWDLTDAAERAVLAGHTRPIHRVSVAELSGRPVAVTTSWDNTVRVWDLTGQTSCTVLTGHTMLVNAVAVTHVHGHPIAVTAGRDETVRLWDLRTATQCGALTGHTSVVIAMAVAHVDGRALAVTTAHDDAVRVWDLATATQRATLTGHSRWVNAVACTTVEGHAVAVSAGEDATVRIWDLATGTHRATLSGHTEAVNALAVTALGDRPVAVTASDDHTVRIWDLTTARERATLTGHTSEVIAVVVAHLGDRPLAISTGIDNTVRIWDLATGTERATIARHLHTVHAATGPGSATAIIDCPIPQPTVAVGPSAEIILGLGNDIVVLTRGR
ncbi:caspase family protein [Nocardia takedensis]|uniref:caspase family protein n=1 Tax=Nocardia takedensis TaxID=259390 RepID=UPI00068545D2|nr:caspase family protein [Nocardia takedensis]